MERITQNNYGYKYELALASETFNDCNNSLEYGINWLDENGEIIDCEWFATETDRQRAINNLI